MCQPRIGIAEDKKMVGGSIKRSLLKEEGLASIRVKKSGIQQPLTPSVPPVLQKESSGTLQNRFVKILLATVLQKQRQYVVGEKQLKKSSKPSSLTVSITQGKPLRAQLVLFHSCRNRLAQTGTDTLVTKTQNVQFLDY